MSGSDRKDEGEFRYRVYFYVEQSSFLNMNTPSATIYSIGHSNHTWERFVELLRPHEIELIIDVRYYPRSRFAPWSNRNQIEHNLSHQNIDYRWKGDSLGGMPRGPKRSTKEEDGSVVEWYQARSTEPDFLAAISEISHLAVRKRLAVMCSEGEPIRCHRTMLLAPAFANLGVDVRHIHPKVLGATFPTALDL